MKLFKVAVRSLLISAELPTRIAVVGIPAALLAFVLSAARAVVRRAQGLCKGARADETAPSHTPFH